MPRATAFGPLGPWALGGREFRGDPCRLGFDPRSHADSHGQVLYTVHSRDPYRPLPLTGRAFDLRGTSLPAGGQALVSGNCTHRTVSLSALSLYAGPCSRLQGPVTAGQGFRPQGGQGPAGFPAPSRPCRQGSLPRPCWQGSLPRRLLARMAGITFNCPVTRPCRQGSYPKDTKIAAGILPYLWL